MAEKYGVIPKKYTKAWWAYFWTYYKWYVIVPIVLAVIITGAIIGNIKMNRIDLTLTYAGPQYISAIEQKEINEQFSTLCPDTNGDGKNMLTTASIAINYEDNDMEYLSSAVTMLQFALYDEEKYVYIMHKDVIPRFFGSNTVNCAYAPVDEWLTADIGDARMISAHDTNYGISLDGSKLFRQWDIDLTDHYLLMRFAPKENASKDEINDYESAKELANILLEQ